KSLRNQSQEENLNLSKYYFNWQLDTTRHSLLNFKGYEAELVTSEVTGLPRLKYDQSKPFTRETTYYNYYVPQDTIDVPAAYIVKRSWKKVIERLDANDIEYFSLSRDTTLTVESYHILDYDTRETPYEGHYLHSNVQVKKNTIKVSFQNGDYVVPSNQAGVRYILETLEPQAADSFFNWNFFDMILQQKEGFSPYVFEDIALDLLKRDSTLRGNFLLKKELEEDFAQDWYAQLDWIYQRSKYREAPYLRYPIYRIAKGSSAASILQE
ncbi:MAG: hypothetical protein AB3N18_09175, partial [Allomuricauda sp.]